MKELGLRFNKINLLLDADYSLEEALEYVSNESVEMSDSESPMSHCYGDLVRTLGNKPD